MYSSWKENVRNKQKENGKKYMTEMGNINLPRYDQDHFIA